MEDYIPFIIVIGIVLLSLTVDWFFIHRRHPWLGYLLGLIPIYAFWQIIMLQTPSAEYCRENPLACEWTGIGIVIVTGLSILMAVAYSTLSLGVTLIYKKAFSGSVSIRPSFQRRLGLTVSLVVTLAVTTTLGGYLGNGIAELINSGIFVRWQSLGSPPEPTLARRLPDEKAIKIQSYTTESVQVETNRGRSFATRLRWCLKERLPQQNCWYYGQSDGKFIRGEFKTCKHQLWVANPPGKVIDQVQTKWCSAVQTEQTNYVVLEDGSIWVWTYSVQTDPFPTAVGAIVPGAILGALGGVIIFSRLKI